MVCHRTDLRVLRSLSRLIFARRGISADRGGDHRPLQVCPDWLGRRLYHFAFETPADFFFLPTRGRSFFSTMGFAFFSAR